MTKPMCMDGSTKSMLIYIYQIVISLLQNKKYTQSTSRIFRFIFCFGKAV